jgi:uncharacterized protein
MPIIELILSRSEDPRRRISLSYETRKTSAGRRYARALQLCRVNGHGVARDDGFYGFAGDPRDPRWIAAEIARHVELVNAHAPGAFPAPSGELSRRDLNELHERFARYSGPLALRPTPFARAPAAVEDALAELNRLIHRHEDWLGARDGVTAAPPAIVVELAAPRARHPLLPEEYADFTLARGFGTCYVNYCEVGKSLWNAFADADDPATAGVRPLRYLSADAYLYFGPTDAPAEVEARRRAFAAWWDERADALAALGFVRDDPRNAVGHLPVADLVRDRGDARGASDAAIVELIARHPRLVDLAIDVDDLAPRVPAALAARTAPPDAAFCWVDLGTPDVDAAKRFYAAVFGWTYADVPADEGAYAVCLAGERPVAALFAMYDRVPYWLPYLAVDDVGALRARAEAAGGRHAPIVHRGFERVADTTDPRVGRGESAFLVDPEGRGVLIRTRALEVACDLPGAPGALAWAELFAPELAAGDFYERVLGWQRGPLADGRGAARRLAAGACGVGVRVAPAPIAHGWYAYFAADDVDATVARARAAGASVIEPVTDVPGAGRFALLRDPQGAPFGVVQT